VPLPHILLDAHHHFFGDSAAVALNERFNVEGEEIIKLEGDFNKYFDLYAPKGQEIVTLQIFSPDIMAQLIDHSKKFSLEFFGNYIYIYSRKAIKNGYEIYAMYSLTRLLIDKLAPELERLK
jgi:hypothetical protein